ncbi:MAG: hypothetical protein MUC88_00410 [Planctomycetes bacterium]|nr:hypothetical protein [Planctomycetota bacterium]
MGKYDTIKVFSATKARDREQLGQRVADWLGSWGGSIVDTRVLQSSDREFHCLSIIVFGLEARADG